MAVALDTNAICAEIGALLDEPADLDVDPMLARIELTLTDGYAQSLSLEGEQRRIERQITEVASSLHEGNRELKTDELAALSSRLAGTNTELTRLRERLMALRAHAALVRRAAA